MKIATFNIWNNPALWEERLYAICKEIKRIDADILALQEVKTYVDEKNDMNVAQFLANQTGYPFFIFKAYPDAPDEGIAFLSKLPIYSKEAIWDTDVKESNYCAIKIIVPYKDYTFDITNVHLNWKSHKTRLQQIEAVHTWVSKDRSNNCFKIICGDFNDTPTSSIHHFLTDHHWVDVAQYKETEENIKAHPTLDFDENIYLKAHASYKTSTRYDWIFIKENNKMSPPLIKAVEIFGDTPTSAITVTPSDHYGVLVEIEVK